MPPVIGRLGKNRSKNANKIKNGKKGKFFTVLGEKNHFGKRGRDKNIIFWAIYTPLSIGDNNNYPVEKKNFTFLYYM